MFCHLCQQHSGAQKLLSMLDFCRRQDEIAIRLSSVPLTAKRVAAARKRRFQAELKEIKDRLSRVKHLTNALSSA